MSLLMFVYLFVQPQLLNNTSSLNSEPVLTNFHSIDPWVNLKIVQRFGIHAGFLLPW